MLAALEMTAQEMRDEYRNHHADLLDDAGGRGDALRPYEWFVAPGNLVRARCKEHKVQMKWAMKLDKRYPDTINKHTRTHHAYPVVYRGLPIQIWKCPAKDCTVEAVK